MTTATDTAAVVAENYAAYKTIAAEHETACQQEAKARAALEELDGERFLRKGLEGKFQDALTAWQERRKTVDELSLQLAILTRRRRALLKAVGQAGEPVE